MTILLIWALVAGQPAFAQHEFADRSACEMTRILVVDQLRAVHIQPVLVICTDEPAT